MMALEQSMETNNQINFDDALRQGAVSEPLLLDMVRAKDIIFDYILEGDVGSIEGVWSRRDSPYCQNQKFLAAVQSAVDKKYITFKDGKLYLLPVCPSENLEHAGIIRAKDHEWHLGDRPGFDNIENLLKNGVFGNSNPGKVTYLRSQGTFVSSFYNPHVHEKDAVVLLNIDTSKLLQLRSLFIDTESVDPHNSRYGDVLGKSFIILGGIPKEAITGYQMTAL